MIATTSDFRTRKDSTSFSEKEFEEFVRPHLTNLVSTSRRILRSEDLAWDAVQETLWTLWQEEELPRRPAGWLLRTVIHRSLCTARSLSRRRCHEKIASQKNSLRHVLADPTVSLEKQEVSRTLRQAISCLSREHQQVFTLCEIEGMDGKEVARTLGLAPGTVKSRLHRARAVLRTKLETMLCDLGIPCPPCSRNKKQSRNAG